MAVWRLPTWRLRGQVVGLVAGIACLAMAAAWASVGGSIVRRFDAAYSEVMRAVRYGDYASDNGARILMAKWAAEAFVTHPVTGIGAGGFRAWAHEHVESTGQEWERRFDEHRRWMIRSFAMTFAAVTLRLYLPIAPILGYDFVDGYRLTAWSSWIPNLIVAELWLRRQMARQAAA